MVRPPAALLLVFVCSAVSLSQERDENTVLPPATKRGNSASIISDENLSTFRTIGSAFFQNTFGPLTVSLNELFISTILQTDRKRITDEQNFGLDLRNRITGQLSAAGKISSLIVSDNQSLGITNLSANAFYGGVEVVPFQSIVVTPMIGMRYENQSEQRDRGVSYLVSLASDPLLYGGYRSGITGKWEYDNLSPRTGETRYLDVSAEKYFFSKTRNFFDFRYSRNKRDFYSPADDVIQSAFGVSNNIETRAEDAFAILDSLDYTLTDDLFLRFQANVLSRSIDRETRYKYYAGNPNPGANTTTQEVKFEGGAEALFTAGNDFSTSLRAFYQERDEKHLVGPDDSLTNSNLAKYTALEERRNNHSRRTWLSSMTSWAFSSSQSVSLTASTSILRYDTPRQDNDDDRDELAYILSLSYFVRINRHLAMKIFADANLNHLVYLISTRSADNTWNRIIRLSPRLEYVPSDAVTSVNTFEVLANYTSYDFEYPSSPIRSYVFRQFGFIDSTAIILTDRVGVDFFALMKLYERGELQWAEFEERPLTYFDERTIMGSVRYRFPSGLLFSVGLRYFNQSRFTYTGSERTLEERLRSIGPVTSIEWLIAGRTAFSLRGWYEDQQQTGAPRRGIVTMTMSLVVHI